MKANDIGHAPWLFIAALIGLVAINWAAETPVALSTPQIQAKIMHHQELETQIVRALDDEALWRVPAKHDAWLLHLRCVREYRTASAVPVLLTHSGFQAKRQKTGPDADCR